eukprot:comp23274_c0_seq1/m.38097 comp23274_c0_seq1/g.38097  ORF comp23274_c0_seq1/g.38097 comp23274_c0_seq1/m.38097 type:complete len:723 (-) comp23274_c0_seq1:698-2866(-)
MAPVAFRLPASRRPSLRLWREVGRSLHARWLGTTSQHRLALFEQFKSSQPIIDGRSSRPFQIVLDGTLVESSQIAAEKNVAVTPLNVVKSVSRALMKDAVCARVNGQIWDMTRPLWQALAENGTPPPLHLEVVKTDDPDGRFVFAHSSAHVLGLALEAIYGDNLLLVDGPPIKKGLGGEFFYEARFQDGGVVTTADLEKINAKAREIVKANIPFERIEISQSQAEALFQHNPYKLHFIRGLSPNTLISAYRLGDLVDFCSGPHLMSSGQVKAIDITRVSGAYFLGKQTNDELQRAYGVAFPKQAQLDAWRKQQQEAAARDHRVVGPRQGLFMLHPYSPGSPFFLPHGMRIFNKLVDLIRKEYVLGGYEEVGSPSLYSKELWQTSGHWDLYKDDMFVVFGGVKKVQADEEASIGLKPMNCPGHCLMFGHGSHSYRDLPIRLADFSALHRNEITGALSGLTRVRKFHQDDAHIFCRPNQIASEVASCLGMLERLYSIFGFTHTFALSTRPDDYIGSLDDWNEAEDALVGCLKNTGKSFTIHEKDGAFYGPKIDITVTDALGREHQTATIQLDFQLPKRFNIHYTDETGKKATPVMIHRAMLGSVERMLALLIEHTAGKWPLWISPRQALVVPVASTPALAQFSEDVAKKLRHEGFYADADSRDETLKKRIRNGQEQQYNYILVVGEREAAAGQVNVRTRSGEQIGSVNVDEFIQTLRQKVDRYE